MSVNLSSTTWRLRTAGGIPYKLVDGYPKASFEEEDPIKLLERDAVEQGLASPAVLERIRSEVEKDIEEAQAFAEEGADPLPEEDAGLIYAGGE